jgi:hypothetical protein
VLWVLYFRLHEEFVKAVKYAALKHPEAEYVRSEFFSFLDLLLQNPFVDIKPPKSSKKLM